MNKNIKDALLVLFLFLVSLLWIIAGGIMYFNGTFEGTFIKEIYPPMFFGFGTGFLTFLQAAFRKNLKWMLLSVPITFIATILWWHSSIPEAIFVVLLDCS